MTFNHTENFTVLPASINLINTNFDVETESLDIGIGESVLTTPIDSLVIIFSYNGNLPVRVIQNGLYMTEYIQSIYNSSGEVLEMSMVDFFPEEVSIDPSLLTSKMIYNKNIGNTGFTLAYPYSIATFYDSDRNIYLIPEYVQFLITRIS